VNALVHEHESKQIIVLKCLVDLKRTLIMKSIESFELMHYKLHDSSKVCTKKCQDQRLVFCRSTLLALIFYTKLAK
jgi:hypothetical protein